MHIRGALGEDAEAACIVMRRSIAELCHADHQNDPVILQRWLKNKTPSVFRLWLTRADNSVLVAGEGEMILAVGAVTDSGYVNLNYFSPAARFQGISRRMLACLEVRAMERGCTRWTVDSTETARRFYLANGYVDDRLSAGYSGPVSGYPMVKALRHD